METGRTCSGLSGGLRGKTILPGPDEGGKTLAPDSSSRNPLPALIAVGLPSILCCCGARDREFPPLDLTGPGTPVPVRVCLSDCEPLQLGISRIASTYKDPCVVEDVDDVPSLFMVTERLG